MIRTGYSGLLLTLLLTGCATVATPSWTVQHSLVQWTVVDAEQVDGYCRSRGVRSDGRILACAFASTLPPHHDASSCEIVAPEGYEWDDLFALGHEVMHCFRGAWHADKDTH